MKHRTPAWYDAQYNNRANIPEHPVILREWAERSARARAESPCRLDLRYGPGEGEGLDLFGARAPLAAGDRGAPVLVYVHGGYWRALSKSDQSFIAPPFVEAGAVVVVPDYALAPAVTLEHIVLQVARSVAWVWQQAPTFGGDRSRIVVAGHSAGGHLAAMMLQCRWPQLVPGLPAQVVHGALSLSGLFELEPLRHAPFLAPDLRLDEHSARRLSPAAMPAPAHGTLVALVGARETPEFHRQNQLIRKVWGRQAVPVCEAVPDHHHMGILAELADPGSRTHGLALGLLGLWDRD